MEVYTSYGDNSEASMPTLEVRRPEMARLIADKLVADPIFGSPSGLFLAAPRRTGKSTFLRKDLKPLLQERGMIVLYVDLWSNRRADPGDLIAGSVKAGITDHGSAIQRFAKKLRIESLGMFGASIDLGLESSTDGTISEAMRILTASTEKDVVMIIDEAQQSLESEAGLNAMFALKAARDEVNQGEDGRHLFLVMTGSHRDKLAALVNGHKAPFYGAAVNVFPALGREFSVAVAGQVNARLVESAHVSVDEVDEAFTVLGRKPESLLFFASSQC